MRYRSRSDPGHQQFVVAFKRCGFAARTVKWPADVVIAKGGRMAFVELKRDEKAPLTEDQEALIRDGFPVFVVWNVEQVATIAKMWR